MFERKKRMRMIHVVWVSVVVIFFNACGGEEKSSEPSQNASEITNTTLQVDAGEDVIVAVRVGHQIGEAREPAGRREG